MSELSACRTEHPHDFTTNMHGEVISYSYDQSRRKTVNMFVRSSPLHDYTFARTFSNWDVINQVMITVDRDMVTYFKAGFHMIADDRGSQIAKCSAIVCDHMETQFCDPAIVIAYDRRR